MHETCICCFKRSKRLAIYYSTQCNLPTARPPTPMFDLRLRLFFLCIYKYYYFMYANSCCFCCGESFKDKRVLPYPCYPNRNCFIIMCRNIIYLL